MTRTSRFLSSLAAALAAFALSCLTAWAGWESTYKDGKAAYEAGDHGKAIKLLREAINEKKDEKFNAIKASGMFFDSYLPHYYLGLALFQRKEYKAAIEELNTSESMKVIQKLKELYNQLKQTRSAAEAASGSETPPQVAVQPPVPPSPSPPKPSPPEPPKEPARDPGKEPPKEPAREPPKVAVPVGPDPALTQAISAATNDILAAQKFAVDNGKYLDDSEKRRLDGLVGEIRGAQTVAAAGARRQELVKEVAEMRTKAGARRKEEEDRVARQKKDDEALQARMAHDKALADAAGRAAPAFQEAESFLSENRANLTPGEAQRIQGLLDGAKKGTSPDAVTKGAADLRVAVAASRKSLDDRRASGAKDAQAQYAKGVTAYFEGRYDDALPALRQASGGLPKEAGLRAFLGCAYYKKYLLTKETDAALKQQAEEAFRAAAAADRNYTLDPRYFPPKVVAFYREVSAKR